MLVSVPDIDELVPLPDTARDAMPELSPHEELAMRARTIKLLSDITGQVIAPTEQQQATANKLAKQMIEDPDFRPEFAQYPNETMAYLSGLVTQFNCKIVDELSDLKLYVVNRLVYEIETTPNPKIRLTALSKLGEIDGVDAFKRRSEMTHIVKPIEEVEKELLNVLENIEYRVVDPVNRARAQHGALNPLPGPENVKNHEEMTVFDAESASESPSERSTGPAGPYSASREGDIE